MTHSKEMLCLLLMEVVMQYHNFAPYKKFQYKFLLLKTSLRLFSYMLLWNDNMCKSTAVTPLISRLLPMNCQQHMYTQGCIQLSMYWGYVLRKLLMDLNWLKLKFKKWNYIIHMQTNKEIDVVKLQKFTYSDTLADSLTSQW